eukprot:3955472-Amphidinium_carterae.1
MIGVRRSFRGRNTAGAFTDAVPEEDSEPITLPFPKGTPREICSTTVTLLDRLLRELFFNVCDGIAV